MRYVLKEKEKGEKALLLFFMVLLRECARRRVMRKRVLEGVVLILLGGHAFLGGVVLSYIFPCRIERILIVVFAISIMGVLYIRDSLKKNRASTENAFSELEERLTSLEGEVSCIEAEAWAEKVEAREKQRKFPPCRP